MMSPVVLPPFCDPNGFYMLPLKPPFIFQGVTTHVFPIRAKLAALQGLADSYLNIVPPEVAYFRAAMPCAMLMVLDYGRLALQAKNLGWLSQQEVMFAVIYERYRKIDGRLVFQDWASLSPFIFVDSDISMAMGRTVVGWPKLRCVLQPVKLTWIHDPNAPVNLASVHSTVIPEVYLGDKEQLREILSIYRGYIPVAVVPPDAHSPMAPWSMMANTVATMSNSATDFAQVLMNRASQSREYVGADALVEMFARLAEMYDPLRPDIFMDTVNLKQFRDSERPENYCYQALTSARMRFTAFNRGGLLGNPSTFAGDLSGGMMVALPRYASLPIADTLGLTPDHVVPGDGDAPEVSMFKPVLPFWYNVDMRYEQGFNAAWRGLDGTWHDTLGREYPTPITDRRFNTTLGATSHAVAGPFDFNSTTVRVMPLLARADTLRTFLYKYLNRMLAEGPADTRARFELWTSDETSESAYVYMLITTYDDITSGTDNIGTWVSHDITFLVPVRLQERVAEDGTWVTRAVGSVPVFSYAGDTTSVVSDSEVLGIPTTRATFTSPPNTWMSRDPARDAPARLLDVAAEVLPALNTGQEAVQRVIFEVLSGEVAPIKSVPASRRVAERYEQLLHEELERKWAVRKQDAFLNAQALGLRAFTGDDPLNLFTMKQFRDMADPDGACYQSIVRVQRTVRHVYDLREIDEAMHLRVHEYGSQPIVETLGIEADLASLQDGGRVYVMRPLRPFWMRIAWREELGQRLWWRVGSSEWQGNPFRTDLWNAPNGFTLLAPDEQRLPAVPLRVDAVDQGQPLRVKSVTSSVDGAPLNAQQARAAVDRVDPQSVLESYLSREWENWNPDARWQTRRAALLQSLFDRKECSLKTEHRDVEIAFFDEQLRALDRGLVDEHTLRVLELRMKLFRAFARGRQALERATADRAVDVDKAQHALDALASAISGILDSAPDTLQGRLVDHDRMRDFADHVKRFDEAGATGLRAFLTRMRVDVTAPQSAPTLDDWRRADSAVRAEFKRLRESLLDSLSKTAQKPDFCIPRTWLGAERDRAFPRTDAWDESWYARPRLARRND